MSRPNSDSGEDRNIVGWDKNDKENPREWQTRYKIFVTFQLGLLALAASLGSSIISPATDTIAQVVGVSEEAAVLCLSLYV